MQGKTTSHALSDGFQSSYFDGDGRRRSGRKVPERTIEPGSAEWNARGIKVKQPPGRAAPAPAATRSAARAARTIPLEATLELRDVDEVEGKGVFTTVAIRKGQACCEYKGEVIGLEEANARNDAGHGFYLMRATEVRGPDVEDDESEDDESEDDEPVRFIDAIDDDCKARFVNHSDKPNVWAKICDDGRVVFHASEYIPRGKQLLIDYGDDYRWDGTVPVELREASPERPKPRRSKRSKSSSSGPGIAEPKKFQYSRPTYETEPLPLRKDAPRPQPVPEPEPEPEPETVTWYDGYSTFDEWAGANGLPRNVFQNLGKARGVALHKKLASIDEAAIQLCSMDLTDPDEEEEDEPLEEPPASNSGRNGRSALVNAAAAMGDS